jgi:hypothetical protein
MPILSKTTLKFQNTKTSKTSIYNANSNTFKELMSQNYLSDTVFLIVYKPISGSFTLSVSNLYIRLQQSFNVKNATQTQPNEKKNYYKVLFLLQTK